MNTLKRLINQVKGLFPSPLPQGLPRFHQWAKEIADTYDMPTEDQRSITYALATMVVHLGPAVHKRAKYTFAKELRASAAKQVAGSAFAELKHQQQEEAAKKAAELNVTVTK